MVYVINYDEKALMPCSNAIARLLLKERKAKVVKRCPFTIKLKHQTSTYTQPLTLGIDTGSRTIGSAVVNAKNEVVYISEIQIRNDIADNGFGMFRVMLNYKLQDRGKYFVKIDKWFPSSKTCNECGHINKELKLGEEKWTCSSCNTSLDRDYNAAKNIKKEGFKILSKELAC